MLYHTNLDQRPTLLMTFDSANDWLQEKDEQHLKH